MKTNISKHIIVDLLPAYLSSEASQETIELIEQFAQQDAEIAELINEAKAANSSGLDSKSAATHSLATESIGSESLEVCEAAEKMEQKVLHKIKHKIRKQMLMVAAATTAILLIPLTAMNFTDEVNWNGLDFVVMAILLMGAGLAYVFVANLSKSYAYKLGVAITVLTGFLLVWINLAVGMIGSANNPANLLYGLVLFTGLAGAVKSKFEPTGMAKSLFTASVVQFLIPFIALIIWQPSISHQSPNADTGLVTLFVFNTFFALLLSAAGLLFRKSAKGLVT
jgi:hypothetical protein